MEPYRRTVYGAAVQTAQVLGIAWDIPTHTTLNEKLSIQAGTALGPNEQPRMRYITIGIGGHKGVVGADNLTIIEPIQHDATHGAPYKMLPFVMRPLDNDLTPEEMERYGLRRIENHHNVDYAVYYAKRLDLTGVQIQFKKKTIVRGKQTVDDFIPSAENLSPTPPVTQPGAHTVDGTYVYATAEVQVEIDAFDAKEILNAAKILHGSEHYAFISEIQFVTGVDRVVQIQSGGQSMNMKEIIAAQTFCHVSAMRPLFSEQDGFTLTYNLGIGEPMLSLQGP